MTKYLAWDYEEGAEPAYWHIYDCDKAPTDVVDFGGFSIITIIGPDTPEMQEAVIAICEAIDKSIDLALKLRDEA